MLPKLYWKNCMAGYLSSIYELLFVKGSFIKHHLLEFNDIGLTISQKMKAESLEWNQAIINFIQNCY